MKFFYSIIIAAFTHSIYAQEVLVPPAGQRTSKLQIGVSFSPDLNCRRLSAAQGADSIQPIIDIFNKTETQKISYTAGIKLLYKISPKISLESGALFSNKGYQRKLQSYYWPDMTVTNAKVVYNYSYLDFPLTLRWQWKNKSSYFYLSGGVVNHFLMDQYLIAVIEERKKSKIDHDLNTYSVSAALGFGFNFQISQSFALGINPIARYQLINIRKAWMRENLWNAGLDISLYKRI